MKAVILAAGQGTRLRPLTDERPKCMVDLFGKPILQHQVETLRRNGIEDIVVVTGYQADRITVPGIRTVHNPRYAETNMVSSLFTAERELSSDFLMCYGDIVYHDSLVQAMQASTAEIAVAIDRQWEALWSLRMEDPLSDAETLKLSDTGQIIELGAKPGSMSDIEGQYVGLVAFRGAAVLKIKKLYHSLDQEQMFEGKTFDNMYMTSFLMEISRQVQALQAVEVHGGWCEVDSTEDRAAYEKLGPQLLQPEGALTLTSATAD